MAFVMYLASQLGITAGIQTLVTGLLIVGLLFLILRKS